ncbi:hypothetical protein BKA62DRAFT_626226, partial [Auriculariales sp. MPI-PUGE-AT-0066]
FGVLDDILVVSHKHRADRRQRLEKLRLALQVEWQYIWASDSSSPEIANIMDNLRQVRAKWTAKDFVWPSLSPPRGQDDPSELVPDAVFPPDGAELWYNKHAEVDEKAAAEPRPEAYVNRMKPQTLEHGLPLTPSQTANYLSHMRVLRMIASQPFANYTALVLEDDVDIEWDVERILRRVLAVGRIQPTTAQPTLGLPADWDIIYLGHCSPRPRAHETLVRSEDTESHYMPVAGLPNVRPSWMPSCAHAYALTRNGARRLLSQMRYPLFAFSKPVENAFLDLVHPVRSEDPSSGRVRSFSFMPPLVVRVRHLHPIQPFEN